MTPRGADRAENGAERQRCLPLNEAVLSRVGTLDVTLLRTD